MVHHKDSYLHSKPMIGNAFLERKNRHKLKKKRTWSERKKTFLLFLLLQKIPGKHWNMLKNLLHPSCWENSGHSWYFLANIKSSLHMRCVSMHHGRGLNLEHLLWWWSLALWCSFSLIFCITKDKNYILSSYSCLVFLLFYIVITVPEKRFRPWVAVQIWILVMSDTSS